MFENESQFIPSQELSDDIKSPDIKVDKENQGMTVKEFDGKLEEFARNKYLKLFKQIKDYFNENKITKEQYEDSIKKISNLSEKELGYRITEKYTFPEKAEEILGQDFLGPKDIEKVFGIEIKDVPPIPFGVEDINRAKELGQFLIFRTDEITEDKLNLPNVKQKLKKAPEKHWALVTKDIIPFNSVRNYYIKQTTDMIKYLKNVVFKDEDLNDLSIPKEYEKAINEFETQKEELRLLAQKSNEWKETAKRLVNLKITRLTRRTIDELFYDLEVYYQKNNSYLLSDSQDWTSSCSSSGRPFVVGYFDFDGVRVSARKPGESRGDHLGVCLSRTI